MLRAEKYNRVFYSGTEAFFVHSSELRRWYRDDNLPLTNTPIPVTTLPIGKRPALNFFKGEMPQ